MQTPYNNNNNNNNNKAYTPLSEKCSQSRDLYIIDAIICSQV